MKLYDILVEATSEDLYRKIADRLEKEFPDLEDKMIEFGSYLSKNLRMENELDQKDPDSQKAPSFEALHSFISIIENYLKVYDSTTFPAIKEKIEKSIEKGFDDHIKIQKRHHEELKNLLQMKNNPPSREELEKDAERYIKTLEKDLQDMKSDINSFGSKAGFKNTNFN